MHRANLDFGVSNGAWAYLYMHTLAKCGLIALYSVRYTFSPVAVTPLDILMTLDSYPIYH